MRDHAPLPRLYLITDRHAPNGERLVEAVGCAMEGGVRLVQLREKGLPIAEFRSLARELRRVADAYGARLLLNASDDPARIELAVEIGADGVHLTSAAAPWIADVRTALGADALVGVSTHSLAEVTRATRAEASFVTFGPVFDTPSKRGLGEPSGLAALRDAVRAAAPMPIYALGGIDLANIHRVPASGAHGVAMIRAILATSDPRASSRALLARLEAQG